MGALAGSTMFSMTIGWASLLLLGRCDIRTGDMIDGELSDTKGMAAALTMSEPGALLTSSQMYLGLECRLTRILVSRLR